MKQVSMAKLFQAEYVDCFNIGIDWLGTRKCKQIADNSTHIYDKFQEANDNSSPNVSNKHRKRK